jgi:prepilin-type N-terminal cleavage/methylation domain-containing protein
MPNKKGFTLIEIIIVIAVLATILSFGMTINLNAFTGDIFLAEQSKIVGILERARSHAMANMFESFYGVCYNSPNYIIFRNRTACLPVSSTDEIIPADTNIKITFPTIVFNQLTGNTTGASVNITNEIKSADIVINNEGAINW